MLKYRPIDIKRDKEIILELQCQVNYACESPCFQDKSYEKYRKKWRSSGQTKEFLSRLRKSMKEKRTIAVMVEKNSTDFTDTVPSEMDPKGRWSEANINNLRRLPRHCVPRNDYVGLHREVVGYMWVQFFDVIGYNLTYTEISELAVVPKYQRKGIATRMIKYIEDISRKRGIKYIRSGTGILNIPSQKLQKKLGYKPIWTRYEKKLK
jgi:ribosomal protein S18 acetylase RimI-like enzyme